MTLTDGLSFWRQFQVPLTPLTKNTMDVNGSQNCLVTNIFQNIFFYVTEKKEIHTGLERHEAE